MATFRTGAGRTPQARVRVGVASTSHMRVQAGKQGLHELGLSLGTVQLPG